MADTSSRTVAEKLAAAKKKHKAYLKEKALKNNGTKLNDPETENTTFQFDTLTRSVETQNQNNVVRSENLSDDFENVDKQEVSDSNEYEADLPLPQYSMDNNLQASSLPDPLSFFDNFNYTNVGSTFQTFTQPLTSFFNNPNKNESDEVMELPNQILVEEKNMNIVPANYTQVVQNTVNVDATEQQFFSYDRFKINALNDPVNEKKSQEGFGDLKEELFSEPVFDQFTNSAELPMGFQNSGPGLQNSGNFVVPPMGLQKSENFVVPPMGSQESENIVVPSMGLQNSEIFVVPSMGLQNSESFVVPSMGLQKSENFVVPSMGLQNSGSFVVPSVGFQTSENFVIPSMDSQNSEEFVLPSVGLQKSEDFVVPSMGLKNSENVLIPTFGQSNNEILIPNDLHGAFEIDAQKPIKEDKLLTFEMKPNLEIPVSESDNTFSHQPISIPAFEAPSSSSNILNLSNELKDYIKEEQSFLGNSSIPQGEGSEEQNQELMSLVEKLNAKCVELSQKLYESETRNSKLEIEYRNLETSRQIESDLESRSSNEMVNDLSKLREDLQCHLQTIGMLVAEKTELTTLLQETQTAFRNESSQCIDLQNEIKEMKIYYSDLEHELQSLKSDKMNLNSTQKEQADMFEKIRKELNETKLQCEERGQDLLESREKLKAVTENNETLQKQIQEMSGQLSMANIKIQQLTLQDSSNMESKIQKLSEEKASYEKQISILNDNLKTLSKEREECGLQYQQYAQQLNDHISNLVQQLEQQQQRYEQLKIQEENRVKHIGDLEKQLQNVQSDNTSYNLQRNNSFLKKELESSTELSQNLQAEKEQLNMDLTKALSEKEMLEKEVEGYKYSISQLESTVEQLRGSQPNNAVLLATMESDKVAASRAISQNNELKKQMEGMQEVMLKVNNDNVQLTEIVSMERKTNKDLLEKLQKTEISFQTVAEAIEIKDKELIHLRDQIEYLSKQIIHQEQLSDRLRHYEAQTHSSPSLQVELQEAKQMIAHLTNELNIMKMNQLNQTSQMSQTIPVGQTNQMNQTVKIEAVNRSSQIDQMTIQTNNHQNESVGQEKTEENDVMNELRTQLSNLQIKNRELETMLQNVQSTTDQKKVDANGNEHLDKNTAMMHLEKKFLRTMEEIARLTEEKQRLEHLVLQLQGETETIGEYVTLYQQQRSILKQRALEKDQQLEQLTNDRESIKANLDRLNNLVKKLIVEKGAIPKELLDQHEHFGKDRNDLCTEHQKIHQEINKITSNGINSMGVVDDSNTEIAEEIISLLSEIKSSNLVQPNEESLHHCAWCSGKLITV